MKRILIKSIPYTICIAIALVLLVIASQTENNLKSLFQSISASFLAIPCLFLGYELVKSFTDKHLNREIFDYAKLQVDSNMLSIVNQLQKLSYHYDERDSSLEGFNDMLAVKEIDLLTRMQSTEFIGFQVFKHWEITEVALHKILENSFILKKLTNEQIICIIDLIKKLRNLESFQKVQDLYSVSEQKVDEYVIKSGKSINNTNDNYPNRYLLLKKLGKGNFQVVDFGDFYKDKSAIALNICYVNNVYLIPFSHAIYSVLQSISQWGKVTGNEFLIDSKQFRIRKVKK